MEVDRTVFLRVGSTSPTRYECRYTALRQGDLGSLEKCPESNQKDIAMQVAIASHPGILWVGKAILRKLATDSYQATWPI